jgi:homoserine dehydrogenase
VGLAGFGALGASVALRLTGADAPPSLDLTCLADRRAHDKRGRQPAGSPLHRLTWTDRPDDLLTSDVDVIIDATPRTEPVGDFVRAALLTGKSVVTANEQVVAHHGPTLLALAERQGRQLRFGAAVGGAMPIVRVLSDGLIGDRILSVDAILNSTANLVLSRVSEAGGALDDAIAEACAAGFAQGDPAADMSGADAAAKLAVLCALAFHLRVPPARIETHPVARIGEAVLRKARLAAGTIRQIAHAAYDPERGRLDAWVAPIIVPQDSPFGRTTGPENTAVLVTAHAGTVTLSGVGGGAEAMSAALIGDVIAIARDRAAIVPAPVLIEPKEIRGLADSRVAEAV